ncbi:uncharacterized protein LOC143299031 [Babylonia areolata]|uniref:uncharacterized protein LOC143299031 n=1 Tax=Babylonia areolata TaxID=304850 RepID=UPI003FD4B1A0
MVTKAPLTSSPIPTTTPATFSTTTANSSLLNSTAPGSSLVPPAWIRNDFMRAVMLSMQVLGTLQAILIIGANLLLLAAILTSSLLRSRMRNKLVINVVVANLFVGVLGAPFTVDYTVREQWVHGCYFIVILIVLVAFVQNFISMWGVVALLLHYLARLLRYEGPRWLGRLPAWLQRALPALLIASPWLVAGVLLLPMIFGGLNRDVLTVWNDNACPLVLEKWAKSVLNALSFFVPAVVLIVLVILLVLFRHKQEATKEDVAPSRAETGQAVMSATAQELESCWVHVLVAVLSVLMMGPEHTFLIVRRGPWKHILIASVVIHFLSDMLPFVVALVWLLMLPDVRGRVKEGATKLWANVVSFTTRSPPQAAGTTSVTPVTFRDLHDE